MSYEFTKQIGETVPGVGIDFRKRLVLGEIISSCSVTCEDLPELISASTIEGTKVLATVTGGVGGEFKVVYKATGDKGSIREADLTIVVVEV